MRETLKQIGMVLGVLVVVVVVLLGLTMPRETASAFNRHAETQG